jgi:uncharacterized protein (TIGR00730 family)
MSTTEATAERTIGSLCVYCASSTGSNPALAAAAEELGRLLAKEKIELVYGGGAVGLMGLIADTVMDGGGAVTGVIPSALMPREVAHRGITSLIEVETMHERKAEMISRADAFVALPGGFGTLEELTEVLTWAQLGIHDKPIGLLNVDGFYDHLLLLLERCIEDQVLKQKNRLMLIDRSTPSELLTALRTSSTPFEPKWLDKPAGADQG